MPMAVGSSDAGAVPRTGPNRVFPRMMRPAGDDFTMFTGTIAIALEHDGRDVRGARVRDLLTGSEYSIEARATVVCADSVRTPQLLFASEIRPAALGRYLNEHAFLTGQVIGDTRRLDIRLSEIPLPRDGEWLLGSYWLPHSGDAQPFHGQIMDRVYVDESGERLAYAVGLSWYAPTEVSRDNRLVFDADTRDAAGMPGVRVDFRRSAGDEESIEAARASQRRAGEALGDFEPDRDSALLPPGSSLHLTGTARSGVADDGSSVCDPHGRVWGFDNLYLSGGAVVPTAVVGNSTLTAMITAVRAARQIVREHT